MPTLANRYSISMQPEHAEVQIGELVVRTDPQNGKLAVHISDRIFNVFQAMRLADPAPPLCALGSLTIKDDKMAGRMLPGDQLVIDTSDSYIPREGGAFAVVLEQPSVCCRRLTRLEDGRLRVTHDNEAYVNQDVTLSESESAQLLVAGRVKLLQGRI